MGILSGVFPEAESSDKGIGVIAGAAAWRQFLELFHVASAQNHVFGFERGRQIGDNLRDIALPLSLSGALQASLSDVFFIGVPFVRQVAEFHRLHNAVDDHRRAQTRPEAQEQHLSAFVAPQSLHRGIVDQLHRLPERRGEVNPGPPASQVVWFRDGHIAEDRSGVAN